MPLRRWGQVVRSSCGRFSRGARGGWEHGDTGWCPRMCLCAGTGAKDVRIRKHETTVRDEGSACTINQLLHPPPSLANSVYPSCPSVHWWYKHFLTSVSAISGVSPMGWCVVLLIRYLGIVWGPGYPREQVGKPSPPPNFQRVHYD